MSCLTSFPVRLQTLAGRRAACSLGTAPPHHARPPLPFCSNPALVCGTSRLDQLGSTQLAGPRSAGRAMCSPFPPDPCCLLGGLCHKFHCRQI